MPKQVIISMLQNYPFGQCEQCTNENTRVLVRKIYQVSLQERNKLLEKVNILRKLKNQHMIKIQSVLEEEESIHFLFQYIPIKLQTWISNINDQFIENFRDQLIKFSSFLANNYIKIEFQLKNIGMDQNYGAKYFLDINFDLDPSINRQKLKSSYIREITNLFKPYILNSNNNNNNHPAPDSDRQRVSSDFKTKEPVTKGSETARRQDTSISPPTNKPGNKNKDKALEKYYQQVNMSVDSQNEKILQQFMDVLDNEEEEQTHSQPPPPPQKPAPSNSAMFPKNNNNNNFQPSSLNQIYSQKESSPAQNQNSPYSAKQITTAQNPTQNSMAANQRQSDGLRPANTTLSVSRGKSELKDMSMFWRQSADLQNRVKNAIEKSMNVIKKFKAIKDNMQG